MVFSSPVFLFLFLPLVLLGYFFLPSFLKNLFLFVASFVFYAWGEVEYSYLVLLSIVINYFFAIAIHKSEGVLPRVFLIAGVSLNLLPLIYYKYSTFIKSSFGFDHSEPITLPLGISFFTFHALSYIIDVYRKKSSPQRSLINLGLYIINFPQLIAGPIVRYPEIENQLYNHNVSVSGFADGIKRFIIGLSKKVLIANTVATVADPVFSMDIQNISFGTAWLAILCYSLQIYFDFSEYSDMAIGLGKMFGFNFPENFRYPYTASSIKDFWRRWHISLSNWFRDYVYIPLGGSHAGRMRTYSNLFTIFFLCGLWHGASWNFVIWGIWHGMFLVLERQKFGGLIKSMPLIAQHLYTLLIIIIGWVFFRSADLNFSFQFLEILFGFKNGSLTFSLYYFPDTDLILAITIGLIASTPVLRKLPPLIKEKKGEIIFEYLKLSCFLILFILSAMSLASGTYNPFIYFRF